MRLSKRKGDGEKKWDTERDKVGVWDRAGIIELFANCCTCRMLHGPWHGSSLWSRIIISASTRFNCDDYAIVGIHIATGAVAWTGASNAIPVLPHTFSLSLSPFNFLAPSLRHSHFIDIYCSTLFLASVLIDCMKIAQFLVKSIPHYLPPLCLANCRLYCCSRFVFVVALVLLVVVIPATAVLPCAAMALKLR